MLHTVCPAKNDPGQSVDSTSRWPWDKQHDPGEWTEYLFRELVLTVKVKEFVPIRQEVLLSYWNTDSRQVTYLYIPKREYHSVG